MTTPVASPPGSCVVHTLAAFPDLTRLHAAHPQRYPHLLESAVQGTPQARYDILFAFPGNTLCLEADGRLHWPGPPVTGDFLSALDQVWRSAARDFAGAEPNDLIPFCGGWLLYLGYELAHSIEPAIAPVPLDVHMPVAFATRFPAAIIRDHACRCAYLVCENPAAGDLLPIMQADVLACAHETESALVDIHATLQEDPPQWYLQGIQRVLEYIRAGDVFQVNLSRAWDIELARAYAPVDIYRRLRSTNPAPFAGLLTLAPEQAIISSSPERLVEVRAGSVEGPLEVGAALSQEWDDDLDRLLEAPEYVVLWQPEGVCLAAGMSRAEAEYEPTSADLIERLDRLGRDSGVPVERREYPGSDVHSRRRGRHGACHRDAFPPAAGLAVDRAPQELIGQPDGAHPHHFGLDRQVADLAPARGRTIDEGLSHREDEADLGETQCDLRGVWAGVASDQPLSPPSLPPRPRALSLWRPNCPRDVGEGGQQTQDRSHQQRAACRDNEPLRRTHSPKNAQSPPGGRAGTDKQQRQARAEWRVVLV